MEVRRKMGNFDKIIGYEDIKAELIRFADVIKNPEKYSRIGVTLPSGLLIYGDPGLGKSLMAKCFIEEAGCKTYTIRKEKPNGDFVKEIKEVFEMAKDNAPSIVFLDDMDKFANEDYSHKDAEEYVTVQSCIDECRGFGVFVLATVNDKYSLPDSLLRAGRFDETISVGIPKPKDAEKIIEYFLDQKQATGNIDIEELTRLMEGHTCAELETVINKAGIYAGFDGREKINQDDIVKVVLRMMFDSPESVNPTEYRNTKYLAIHEAGHAVVAEVMDPGSVTLVSVCRHSGSIEGITKNRKPDGFASSKQLQEHEIICGLGGKAAVEVILGIEDIGCNEDIESVFDRIENFVSDNCTYGFDTYDEGCASEYLNEMKDRLKAMEAERYYRMAKRIIFENRGFVDAVVEALMDHKTVTYREMQKIRKDCFKEDAKNE